MDSLNSSVRLGFCCWFFIAVATYWNIDSIYSRICVKLLLYLCSVVFVFFLGYTIYDMCIWELFYGFFFIKSNISNTKNKEKFKNSNWFWHAIEIWKFYYHKSLSLFLMSFKGLKVFGAKLYYLKENSNYLSSFSIF